MNAPDRHRRPWVCLWTDALDSRSLAKAGEAAEVLYYRLLALCGECGIGDMIDQSPADIAWRLRMQAEDVEARIARLAEVGCIEIVDASVRIVGWFDRQPAESEAERSRRRRSLTRTQTTPDPVATRSQPGQDPAVTPTRRIVDADKTRQDTHTQPLPTAGDCKPHAKTAAVARVQSPSAPNPEPMPPTAPPGPRIARTTDADLRPWFEAVCRGLRLSLTWGHRYVLPTERLVVHAGLHLLKPPELERIAAHYRATLDKATPSFPRFCEDIDRWRAAWAAATPSAAPKPSAEDLRAQGICPQHPGETLDADGNCDLCQYVAEFHAKGKSA